MSEQNENRFKRNNKSKKGFSDKVGDVLTNVRHFLTRIAKKTGKRIASFFKKLTKEYIPAFWAWLKRIYKKCRIAVKNAVSTAIKAIVSTAKKVKSFFVALFVALKRKLSRGKKSSEDGKPAKEGEKTDKNGKIRAFAKAAVALAVAFAIAVRKIFARLFRKIRRTFAEIFRNIRRFFDKKHKTDKAGNCQAEPTAIDNEASEQTAADEAPAEIAETDEAKADEEIIPNNPVILDDAVETETEADSNCNNIAAEPAQEAEAISDEGKIQPAWRMKNEKTSAPMVSAVDKSRLIHRAPKIKQDKEAEKKSKGPSMWVRDRRPFFGVSIAVAVIRLTLLLVILAGFACMGIGLGIFRAYIASAPELSIEKIENNDQTSYLYDADGELLMEYYNLENRTWASYDEIPTMLKYAVVASEDESFFEHSGFNFKRIVAAVIGNLTDSSAGGGSTITQQVLKLTLLTSQQTYKRKLQEIYLAYQLEQQYSKEDILEWYMNIMPMGGLVYGVEAAADEYFGKELSELNLRECAILAGMTNAPTYYHPRLCMKSEEDGGYGEDGRRRLYARGNYVLTQMYAVGFITEEEYNENLFDLEDMETDQIVVSENSKVYTYEHKYYVEYVLNELVERLMDANDWSGTMGQEQAYSLIRSGGLQIYTAIDVELQTKIENVVYNYENWPTFADKTKYVTSDGIIQPQCAVVAIDNKTGYLKGIVGGRSEPTARLQLNRAYQCVLALGSCIKPMSVYGPALDQGLLGNMVIENIPASINGWISTTGYPRNSDRIYYGPTNIAYALVKSMNIPTARILLQRLGVNRSMSYLRAMNFSETVLSESPSALALGSTGGYLVDSVAAFATLASEGVYKEPLSITGIVDKNGEKIFSTDNQIFRKIFKSSTVFIISSWLHRAVTQPEAPITIELTNKSIELCGKTGTNELNRGIGFIGYSRYYTCGVWIGHDEFYPSFTDDITAMYWASPLWKQVMNVLHEDLDGAKVYDVMPEDVIEVTFCAVSGKLPNGDICEHDQHVGNKYYTYKTKTEYYIKGTEPTEICDMHSTALFCKETGRLANEYCTEDCLEERTVVNLTKKSEYLKLIGSENYEYLLFDYFPVFFLAGVPYMPVYDEEGNYVTFVTGEECYCTFHSEDTQGRVMHKEEMTKSAQSLIESVYNKIDSARYKKIISPLQKQQLLLAADYLTDCINKPAYSLVEGEEIYDIDEVEEAYSALESLSETIFDTIDEKLSLKDEYVIKANELTESIRTRLSIREYALVVTADEILSISRSLSAFRAILDLPVYSDDETDKLFDIDEANEAYELLSQEAEELFEILEERAELSPGVTSGIVPVYDDDTVYITGINSQSAILIDAATGRVIAYCDSDERIQPSAMSNILFDMVAIDWLESQQIDINTTKITVTTDTMKKAAELGLSTAGFKSGEIVSIHDLIASTVVSGGGEAVVAIAEYIAGSMDVYVELMNNKAIVLGLENTYFVNCTGKDDAGQYTTSSDMAVILAAAYDYELIRETMTAETFTYAKTNRSAQRIIKTAFNTYRAAYDTNLQNSELENCVKFGGKPSNSSSDRYSWASFATDELDNTYILVTAKSQTSRGVVEDYLYIYDEYADMQAEIILPDPSRDPVVPYEDEYTLDIEDIYSPYAILIDASTGRIIAGKDTDSYIYPASLTKIMTVIVAYEYTEKYGIDIETTYAEITDDIIEYVTENGLATAGFSEGERVTLKDLIYASIMQSGADAVLALADYCAGSEEDFVAMMNAKALRMGLDDTVFVTSTGGHNDGHYSTAKDLAVIMSYAYGVDFIREVLSTDYYTYSETNISSQRTVESGLHSMRRAYNIVLRESQIADAVLLGGKNGYTDEAGICLATFVTDGDGNGYVLITCGASTSSEAVEDYLDIYEMYTPLHLYRTDSNAIIPNEDSQTDEIDTVSSQYAIAIDGITGRIIAGNNINASVSPEMAAKVMLATVICNYAYRNEIDIDTTFVTVSADAVANGLGLTNIGLTAGEIVSVRSLLNSMLAESGADAAYALAEHFFGSEYSAVTVMNAKAKQLGLVNTLFTNCTGEYDDKQYSTVSDMSAMLAYALRYEDIKNALLLTEFTVDETNVSAERNAQSVLLARRLQKSTDESDTIPMNAVTFGGIADGSASARTSLATFAEDSEDKLVIVVTAGATSSKKTVNDYMEIFDVFADFAADTNEE